MYGGFLLACYDDESETYQSACKLGTGFSEEDLKKLSEELQAFVIDKPRSYYSFGDSVEADVWFDPKLVWEVLTADLSLSPVHKVIFEVSIFFNSKVFNSIFYFSERPELGWLKITKELHSDFRVSFEFVMTKSQSKQPTHNKLRICLELKRSTTLQQDLLEQEDAPKQRLTMMIKNCNWTTILI